MKKNKFLKNINILITVLMALFSSSSLAIFSNIGMLNFINVFTFFAFYFLFKKYEGKKSKKQKYLFIFLSIIFSLILNVGKYLDFYKYDYSICALKEVLNFGSLICFIGFTIIIYYILAFLFDDYIRYNFLSNYHYKMTNKKVLMFSFLIILLCWIPYFLNYFPGFVNSDTVGEYGMAAGVVKLADHHPIVHAMFIGMFYNFGVFLFKTGTAGVALATLVQMIIMAFIFSYFICFLYKHKLNKKIIIGSLLFFAILPVNAFFAINTWKDTLFSGVFFLLNLFVFEMLEKNRTISLKDYIIFTILSLLMLFFRNNGIYIYLISSPFLLILFKYNRKIMSFLISSVIIIYFLVKGPLFSYMHIYNTSSAESLSIPMQQIGYIVSKNLDLTDEEREAINDIIDISILKKVYDPTVSDPIKFHENFNIGPYNKNKIKYLNLWLSLLLKHPLSATEAYLNITLGFWYPSMFTSVVPMEIISTNSLDIKSYSICPPILKEYVSNIEPVSRKIPIFNLQWNCAISFWILAIFIVYSYLLNGEKSLILYVPILGIWLTMVIASPVSTSFRYIYGMFISIPYIIVFPYLYKKYILKK